MNEVLTIRDKKYQLFWGICRECQDTHQSWRTYRKYGLVGRSENLSVLLKEIEAHQSETTHQNVRVVVCNVVSIPNTDLSLEEVRDQYKEKIERDREWEEKRIQTRTAEAKTDQKGGKFWKWPSRQASG